MCPPALGSFWNLVYLFSYLPGKAWTLALGLTGLKTGPHWEGSEGAAALHASGSVPCRRVKASLDAPVRDDWVSLSSVIELPPRKGRHSTTQSPSPAPCTRPSKPLSLRPRDHSAEKNQPVYITAVRQRWHITSGPSAYNGFFKCVAMFSWLVVGDLKCQTISLDNYCQGYYLREISF